MTGIFIIMIGTLIFGLVVLYLDKQGRKKAIHKQ